MVAPPRDLAGWSRSPSARRGSAIISAPVNLSEREPARRAGMGKEIAEGITVDPRVMVGKPVIKGTRMPVELVLAKLAANPDLDEFFLDYPEITLDQIRACLRFATALVQDKGRTMQGEALPSPAPAPR